MPGRHRIATRPRQHVHPVRHSHANAGGVAKLCLAGTQNATQHQPRPRVRLQRRHSGDADLCLAGTAADSAASATPPTRANVTPAPALSRICARDAHKRDTAPATGRTCAPRSRQRGRRREIVSGRHTGATQQEPRLRVRPQRRSSSDADLCLSDTPTTLPQPHFQTRANLAPEPALSRICSPTHRNAIGHQTRPLSPAPAVPHLQLCANVAPSALSRTCACEHTNATRFRRPRHIDEPIGRNVSGHVACRRVSRRCRPQSLRRPDRGRRRSRLPRRAPSRVHRGRWRAGAGRVRLRLRLARTT